MLAFPNVSHPVLINVFRPFGDDQLLATLGAFDDRGVVRTKMHQRSLARDLSLPGNVGWQLQSVEGHCRSMALTYDSAI